MKADHLPTSGLRRLWAGLWVLLVVLVLAACSTGENQVRFVTDFESGSIGAVKQLDGDGLSWQLALRAM